MKKILIVEGNLREENQSFTDGGIKTHTESLKDSISYYTNNLQCERRTVEKGRLNVRMF